MRFAIHKSSLGYVLRRFGAVVAVAAALAARAGAQNPPVLPSPLPVDTVGRDVGTVRPGDLLTLAVYKQPELSKTFLIDARGDVNIPGIGSFRVAGLTPAQLHQKFAQEMAATLENPDFTVTPQIRVFVLGEVRTPNLYPVEPGTTLLQVLTLAGGATARADLRRTRVIRDGRSFVVDLDAGLEGGGSGRIVLFSNDYVVVDERRGLTRESISFLIGGVTAVLSLVNLVVAFNK